MFNFRAIKDILPTHRHFFAAIGVFIAAVGYGAYAYKTKGKMSTSVYLMHLRVGAQGAAIASLTLGLIYTMINEHILHRKIE